MLPQLRSKSPMGLLPRITTIKSDNIITGNVGAAVVFIGHTNSAVNSINLRCNGGYKVYKIQ